MHAKPTQPVVWVCVGQRRKPSVRGDTVDRQAKWDLAPVPTIVWWSAFLFLYFFVLFFVLLGIEPRGHSVFNWLNGKAEVGIEEVHLGP